MTISEILKSRDLGITTKAQVKKFYQAVLKAVADGKVAEAGKAEYVNLNDLCKAAGVNDSFKNPDMVLDVGLDDNEQLEALLSGIKKARPAKTVAAYKPSPTGAPLYQAINTAVEFSEGEQHTKAEIQHALKELVTVYSLSQYSLKLPKITAEGFERPVKLPAGYKIPEGAALTTHPSTGEVGIFKVHEGESAPRRSGRTSKK